MWGVMNDDAGRESGESMWSRARVAIWGIALVFLFFYKVYPQKLGRLGLDGGFLGMGGFLVFVTLSDVRSGTSTLSHASFKRSEDSTGFWTAIVIKWCQWWTVGYWYAWRLAWVMAVLSFASRCHRVWGTASYCGRL
jgi:hypothetical protein